MEKITAKQLYRTLWRWHFYAGVFVIPFVIILSISGTIYLFKPQIDAFNDAPYRNLVITGELATADQQVAAAMAGVPNATFNAYELPRKKNDAINIIVNQGGETLRVYIHPQTLKILAIKNEKAHLLRIAHDIHGELLLGKFGSILVELAACWTIVLVLTGVYLWWPRNAAGLAGILYPRFAFKGRLFWRDVHAVVGIWISALVLCMLISGLPWALVWGSAFKEVRELTNTAPQTQDWVIAGRQPSNTINHSEHSEHEGHMMPLNMPLAAENFQIATQKIASQKITTQAITTQKATLDIIVKNAQQLQFAYPVSVTAPTGNLLANKQTWMKQSATNWSVKSNAQNRMLRADAELDASSGQLVSKTEFSQHYMIDRAIGIGVAMHEGQLFGWLNQLLGLLAAVGILMVSVSGFIMWRKRAPQGELGAPPPMPEAKIGMGFVAIIFIAAVLLPALGASLILIFLLETIVFSRWPAAKQWLGLNR